MSQDPRQAADYGSRQVLAARMVLVDLGQVLAAFRDRIVVVGGWVPELSFPDADPEHVGSIDVDLALNTEKLSDGQYAEVIQSLLKTGRYRQGEKQFQLVADVSLDDGEAPVQVEIDFLVPKGKLKKNRPRLVEGFRPQVAEACAAAFRAPVPIVISGRMMSGAQNKVELMVASTADFLIMKAYALGLREKPKDAYDICHCLDNYPGGLDQLAGDWRDRKNDILVATALGYLRDKFAGVDYFGPWCLAEFHGSTDIQEREFHSRRAYELVLAFLTLVG